MIDSLEIFRIELCNDSFIGAWSCYYHRLVDMPILISIFGLTFSICTNIIFRLFHDINCLNRYCYSLLCSLSVTVIFLVVMSKIFVREIG